MSDLISREALLNAMEEERRYLLARGQMGAEHILVHHCLPLIDNATTVEERPQGEWIYTQYDGNANIGNWHCSECRQIIIGGYNQKPYYNYCPNCGADMEREASE